jgi:hypothetical protein
MSIADIFIIWSGLFGCIFILASISTQLRRIADYIEEIKNKLPKP